VASTVDLYFELANPDGQLRPGQRMSVILPMNTPAASDSRCPHPPVLYDIHGGAWVYVNSAPHEYRRQRIEIVQTDGPKVILARGRSLARKSSPRVLPNCLEPSLERVSEGADHTRTSSAMGRGHSVFIIAVVGFKVIQTTSLDVFPEFSPLLVGDSNRGSRIIHF
jgi:hypothetical protein